MFMDKPDMDKHITANNRLCMYQVHLSADGLQNTWLPGKLGNVDE